MGVDAARSGPGTHSSRIEAIRPDDEPDTSEGRRLARLAATGLLDSRPEPAYDRVARFAARLLGTPMALVSLVDDHRTFFKSDVGLPEPWRTLREVPRSHSYCALVVARGEPLVVRDARRDPDVRSTAALVELDVAAYLGVPLRTCDGLVLGALCVVDTQPRAWSDDDVATLAELAAALMTEVALTDQCARAVRADEQLRLLSLAVEQAHDAIIISEAGTVDPALPRVVYVNRAFTQATGYRPEEIVGRTPRILQGPKTDRGTLDEIRRRLAQWEPVRAELVNYRKDGSEFWVELDIRPVADASGRYTHWISVQREVTERKHAEARVRESERTLRAIFDTTFQFIGLIAPDGTLLEANRSSLEFAGVDLDEVIGLPFEETPWWSGSPELQTRLRAAIIEAAQGRFVRFEAEHLGADGAVITVDFSLTPVRDESGQVVMLIPEGRDISERKRAEQVLAGRERLLEMATRSAGLGVWDWDLVSGRLLWEGALHRMAGTSPDSFGSTFASFRALLHPDDREPVVRAIESARDLRREYRGEYRFVHPDDSIRWVTARGGFLYDEVSGQPTRMVGICADVTERRRHEQKARERAEQLAQADRRKDEFLAMLAHELRNPLASISHAVRVLELRDEEETLRSQMRDLIGRQVRNLTRLVDDLLDVTRITRGKIRLRKSEVDLNSLIGRAVVTARPQIQLREHTLHVELPAEPVRLLADPLRLEQVLVNLLSNASKYTEQGGEIHIAAALDGGEVRVSVRDTGIGIAPEFLPRVFEPFAQADRTLHRSGGGLGIGLTLVRSLVRMHGGTVEAKSPGEGRGSEFVVRLPILERAPAPELIGPAPPPPPARPAPKRILVVDDNTHSADSLALILECWGHVVRVCHDGFAALEAANEFEPDVVLLDIGLPGLDGYTVARRLRENRRTRDAVLVAVTGYGGDPDRLHAEGAGFDHHFVKPIDLDGLERLLARLAPLADRRGATTRAARVGAAQADP